MEDIALGEEEEEEEEEGSIRNDAMAIFKGHSGIVNSAKVSKYDGFSAPPPSL